MPLPAALTLIPLHGQILRPDSSGTPAIGTVSFRIEQALRDTTDNVLLAPCTLTATLDATGAFTISLPATDDPDITPSGWTYLVNVNTDIWRAPWRISVPVATAGTLELADIAPAVAPSTLVTYVLASTVGQVGGPAGPLDSNGQVPAAQVPGASPSGTVVSETSYGQASSAGSGPTLSRGDHTHGTPALPTYSQVGADQAGSAIAAVGTHAAASDPHADRAYTDTQVATKPSLASAAAANSAVGDTAATGTGTTAARADHKHGREAFGSVTQQTSYGAASADGTAATVAHSDHTHGTPSLTSSAPTTSAVGDSAAAGNGTTPAKSDHVHGRESFGSVVALSAFNTPSANGSAATPSRSDHVHGAPALPDVWTPADHGLIAWACDPTFPNAGSAPTIGVMALSGLMVRHSATVSTVYASVSGTGSSLANCFAGVYDSAGNLKATTADQSGSWAAGFKTMALTSTFAATPGLYWVAILVGTSTSGAPSFHRVANTTTGFINVGLTAATARGASAGSSLAALPSTITPSSNTLTAFQLWTAVS